MSEMPKPFDPVKAKEEDEAERMRRLHNAFAADMEMLFQSFGRTIELPRLKQ